MCGAPKQVFWDIISILRIPLSPDSAAKVPLVMSIQQIQNGHVQVIIMMTFFSFKYVLTILISAELNLLQFKIIMSQIS